MEYLLEHHLGGANPRKQRHAGVQLLRVDVTEDLLRGAVRRRGEKACTLLQPGAEHGMLQVRGGLPR